MPSTGHGDTSKVTGFFDMFPKNVRGVDTSVTEISLFIIHSSLFNRGLGYGG